tara:strand:+ start:314 stop:676 length:363 start_codon:yes stop_codon:yes gene_type:complete
MNGVNLNVAFRNHGRLKCLQELSEPDNFQGNSKRFLTEVKALTILANDPNLIGLIVSIIDRIVGHQQPERNELINFANRQLQHTFDAERDMLAIDEIQQDQPCANGGQCDGCADHEYCYA